MQVDDFPYLLKCCLLSHREVFFDDLGGLKVVRNGATPSKKHITPPTYSLIWESQEELSVTEIDTKSQSTINNLASIGNTTPSIIANHLNKLVKKIKEELIASDKISLPNIGNIHSSGNFFYVISHPLLFPTFPKLNRTSQTTHTQFSSVNTATKHSGKISPPSSLATNTRIANSVTPQTQKNTIRSNQPLKKLQQPIVNKQYQKTKPAQKVKNVSVVNKAFLQKDAINRQVLVRYILFLIFVLAIIILCIYFSNTTSQVPLGNIII